MATYIQLINVSLDNLTDEQREWVEEMAQEHPSQFVEITDGDESLTREIMLDAIDADQVLYEGYARVVIDPSVNRADYELLSRYAEERHPGYHAGETVLVMGAPITRPSMIPERTTVRLSENERHIVARILNQNPDMNQVFGRAISKALNDWNTNNPQEEIVDADEMGKVTLFEDNAGGLCAVDPNGTAYCNLELTESEFSADAQAILDGNTGDWTITIVEDYIPGKETRIIAVYNGEVSVERSDGEPVAGYSGREYLGLG